MADSLLATYPGWNDQGFITLFHQYRTSISTLPTSSNFTWIDFTDDIQCVWFEIVKPFDYSGASVRLNIDLSISNEPTVRWTSIGSFTIDPSTMGSNTLIGSGIVLRLKGYDNTNAITSNYIFRLAAYGPTYMQNISAMLLECRSSSGNSIQNMEIQVNLYKVF